MKNLYFLRHAFAGKPESPEIDDDRPLTKSGIIKMDIAVSCLIFYTTQRNNTIRKIG
jgi:phosphohistidine phosphatase SixA